MLIIWKEVVCSIDRPSNKTLFAILLISKQIKYIHHLSYKTFVRTTKHVVEGHKGKYRQLHSVSYQLTEKQTVRIDPNNLNTYTFLYTCQIHIPKVWKKTISILNCRLI